VKKVVDVSKIKKGGYIMHDNEAYRVIDITHSKAGKHGHGKYRIDAVSVIGSKKISIVVSSGHKIDVPKIEKHNAQILTIEEKVETINNKKIVKKIANVMDLDSYETFDLEVPEELMNEVKEGDKVMYWTVLDAKVMKQKIK